MTDVVGLYLDPPENAIMLCVDEKSQIQALDRTQPMLPMQPGRPERRTRHYVRHGTTTLFAALQVATGQVNGLCQDRHRHQELLRFLKHLARAYPDQELHLVIDNYAWSRPIRRSGRGPMGRDTIRHSSADSHESPFSQVFAAGSG